MNQFYIFVIRAILGAVFAVILTRFFFPGSGIVWTIGTAICLVGLAYITEFYRRQRKSGEGSDRP